MIDLIYEDNHLLVLNKPAGLLTQPSGSNQPSLEQAAKEWLKDKYEKPGNVFLEAVHRLDKPVSGIVVFGKTGKALTRLNASIRSKHVKKIYIADVEGIPPAKNGVVENFVIHDEHYAQIVASNHSEGKLARLSYRIIETFENEALLEIELETGRYHQIRVQLAGLGCPIRGDRRYGSQRQFFLESIALHHARLLIPHPVTHEILTFEAPLPANFRLFP